MKTELEKIDEYFRVLNYLSCAQIYLKDNPLLKRPLIKEDIKTKLIGHWGSAPGQNFIYLHLNRVINKYDLNMFYISGPGHSGQVVFGASYIEGTYSEVYPEITQNEEGLKKLCKYFSFPGGTSSHASPEVPGSINEGGELGYSLSHAFGAVLDNPDLIAACVVGDGEAETGPLAASWHANKLLDPVEDGVVLPILHLNGYKIANPTILARIPEEELIKYFEGMGYHPYLVEGDEPLVMHQKMMRVMDEVVLEIKNIKNRAKITGDKARPTWPMIILKTPKGWLGLDSYEGKQISGTFRAHQVPIPGGGTEENIKLLEEWLKSYQVDNLFDENGKLVSYLRDLAPKGNKRMSASPHTNGGLLLKELDIPDYTPFALNLNSHGSVDASDMSVLGSYIREVVRKNSNFKIFGPDEALSNKLGPVFEVTNRKFNAETYEYDEFLASDGAVIDSILSEHLCQGMLEGYILTGRHGFFHSYEAFIRIVDSMASQHAKWLKMCSEIPWRAPISSLNYILTSHCWQQDHNGFTHQDPGFLNHLVTKKPSITRIYLPCDANTLLSCFHHIIGTKNYINVIVASKHDRPQWLNIEEAKIHCAKGADIFPWASDDEPDVVLGCAGDTPTLEVIAAKQILKENIPELKVRVVNVVDLMKLVSNYHHPHGLTDDEYNNLFTVDKPIIFAFHGYPDLIHQLTYKRDNQNLHVHGYIEEGTITTPFDMRVKNKIDRYHLVLDVLKYVKLDEEKIKKLTQKCEETLKYHEEYIKEHGTDIPEVINFKWRD
ncbi:MAG: phosphoketolase family protein [Bacilli bacterium]|nr:phosphoketolase family protein [Bacilli bacterium]MDD4795005.1 phosphoketolase family protein [Bacilli bacterium]